MNQAFWTESARNDLASLDDHGGLAVAYVNRVVCAALAAGRFLAEYPRAGPMLASGLRKWSLRGTPYILIYRPTVRGVAIVRVLDARSDWQAGFA